MATLSQRICWPRPLQQFRTSTMNRTLSFIPIGARMHSNAAHTSDLSRLARRIPKGTWDTHMHVVDLETYPLKTSPQYQPASHTMDQAKAFLGQLGIEKMVIVQPSFYGNDNSCTLHGLKELGLERGRAVIQFPPASTSKKQLQKWHDQGARGVRLNFKSIGAAPTADELRDTLQRHAEAVRPFGWVLELYIALESLPLLEVAAQNLPSDTKLCIDHFGHPGAQLLDTATQARDLPGFSSLMNLLEKGNTWIKISASYRLSTDPSHPVVESLCRELVRKRPDRCVFATDWPHTRFDGLAVGAYLEKILDWVEDEGVDLEQVLVRNAEELFDAKG